MTHIGVSAAERKQAQQLIIDASFFLDTSQSAQQDAIDATVNYADFCNEIERYCVQHQYCLIETLAQRLSQHLIEVFALLKLRLTIHKKPFDMPNVASVSITIERP